MWRLALVTAVAAAPLEKVLFSDDVVDSYGARCLDGSPAGYYLREAPGSQDWVFFLEGGGLCIEPLDCLIRAKTSLGSSKTWPPTRIDDYNVLNDNPRENPFASFNAVFVPYCSGDTWLGNSKLKNSYLGDLYTSGHLILEALLDHLHNTTSMRNGVQRTLLSGSSAGGIGVFHNADWLTQVITEKFGFAKAIIKASPQAGLFFPSGPKAGVCLYEEYRLLGDRCPRIDIFESWYVRHAEHAFVDQSCAKHLSDSTRCWDAGILARFVKTPLFIAQNRYDSNQMPGEMLCLGCTSNRSAANYEVQRYMSYFGKHTEATLRDLADNSGHSVYMPNCYMHVGNLCMLGGLAVGGRTYNSSLSSWFFDGVHYALYDDCGDFPCSSICACQQALSPPTVDIIV